MAGWRLPVFSEEHTDHSKQPISTIEEMTLYTDQQMVNTEVRLIILYVVVDGEALCSQQKQDQELTVAQIMNSLLPNPDLN